MLDLQAEQYDHGQSCADLYEAVVQLKRRYDLHPCAVRPRDGLTLRRDSERELVQDLVKRFRELPLEQQRRLPALLNSLAQLEVVIGDLQASQRDFQEVARLVADPISQAEAYHNVYRAALERRDWNEALAALRRAVALDPDAFEPFPFARYEPERLLGAGGFGVSFLCRERDNNRRVVIKALRADSLERDVVALLGEMRIVQDLDHPALIRIHDCAGAGGESSRPYLVLEYFEGQTLAEYVAGQGPLTPEDWLTIAWPLARALQALHGRGILHRSLRPAAVLLAPVVASPGPETASPRWRVKLLDTGLALKRTLIHACASNADACSQTALGRSVARTIPFAPLEVLARPKGRLWIGPHSDIYSFGKLCVFALTGRAAHPSLETGEDKGESDLLHVPAAWRQLLADCTAWTIGGRPEHLGLVLDRLAQLPGAGECIRRIEHDLHAVAIAEHTAALQIDPHQVAALVNRGNAYVRQGELDKALADYSRALELQPGDASLYRRRALVHTRSRALDAAIADYTEALRLEPRNIEAHANRGLAYAQKNDYDHALADYNEALRLNPRDPVLLFHRGNAHYAKGDHNRALADYTEVIRLDPRNLWAHSNRGKLHVLRGDYARAVADFTRVLQLDAHNVSALCDRAAAYSAMDQHEHALADYSAALEIEASLTLYNNRGLEYIALGDLDAAAADFSAAIALGPDFPGPYLLRGNIYADKGEFDKALADFAEAIRLDPEFADGWFDRGNVQLRRGALDEALADYNRALELEADHAAAHFQRGNLHAQRGQWDAAITDYSAVLRLCPEDVAAFTNRGNAYASLGDLQHALADYNAALRLEPDNLLLYHNRGRIHAQLGNYEQAIADNLEVLRLQPDDANTCNNLAWLWATHPRPEQRDPTRAVEYARRACELTQWQIASFLDTLAAAYAAAGRFAEAVEHQRRAVALAGEAEKADYRSRLELYEAGKCL